MDTPKPALKGLAAAFRQVLSPFSSKDIANPDHSNKHSSEMRHWLCGCTGARANSNADSAAADAYLETPLVVRDSSTAGSMIVLNSRTASKVFMSPPSVMAMSNSKLCGSEDWKSLSSTIQSFKDSRQASCNDKFSSYPSSVLVEEQSADAAWREFTSWRLKWMEVSSAHHAAVEHATAALLAGARACMAGHVNVCSVKQAWLAPYCES
jgi:hypothetical protein